MAAFPGPAYFIGMDNVDEKAYIMAIDTHRTSGFAMMPTDFEINCALLPLLRDEVQAYWKSSTPVTTESLEDLVFSVNSWYKARRQ